MNTFCTVIAAILITGFGVSACWLVWEEKHRYRRNNLPYFPMRYTCDRCDWSTMLAGDFDNRVFFSTKHAKINAARRLFTVHDCPQGVDRRERLRRIDDREEV